MLIFTPAIFPSSAQHSLQLIALTQINGSYLLALIVLLTSTHPEAAASFSNRKGAAAPDYHSSINKITSDTHEASLDLLLC